MAGQHRARSGSTGIGVPGSGGRHRAEPSHSDAYVWLGTGALTLGLGVALTGGAGIAQADTASSNAGGPRVTHTTPGAATKSIRTVLSAQTVSNSSPSATSAGAKSTSFVSTKDSVVRQLNPADTGDNSAGPGDSSLASQLIGLGGDSDVTGLGSGISGLSSGPDIPFIELGGGGGGGGLVSKIAKALSGGLL